MDADWSRNLVEALRTFQRRGYLCDMDIASSDGRVFQVHSCVVAATSRLLKAAIAKWIAEPDSDSQQQRLFVQTKTSSEVLEYVVQCMYAGSIKIETDYLEDVQEALSEFEVKDPHALGNDSYDDDDRGTHEGAIVIETEEDQEEDVLFQRQENLSATPDVANKKKRHEPEPMFELDLNSIKKEETLEINQYLEDAVNQGQEGAEDTEVGKEDEVEEEEVDGPDVNDADDTSSEKLSGDDNNTPTNLPGQKGKFQCRECKKVFANGSGLIRHVQCVHKNMRPHQCPDCRVRFKEKSKMRMHISVMHSGTAPILPCTSCDKTFTQKSGLIRHVNTVHKQLRPFRCDQCERTYSERSKLTQHFFRVHSGLDRPVAQTRTTTTTSGAQKLVPSQCDKCGKNFRLPSQLKRHMNTVHCDLRPFQCTQCDKAFKEKIKLTEHMRTHTKELIHQCPKCNSRFALRSSFWRHKLTCKNDHKPHQCPSCGKCFKLKDQVEIHVKYVHKGVKEHHCTHCFKAFRSRTLLVVHERIHTNTIAFQCQVCPRGFNQLGAYKIHMKRYHTGERPYPCRTCSKAYVTSYERKIHEFTHKESKDFQCTVCGKSFPGPGNLFMHAKTHSNLRPFGCKFCHKAFKTKSHLSRHEDTHKSYVIVFQTDADTGSTVI